MASSNDKDWLHPDAPYALAAAAVDTLHAAMRAEHSIRMCIAHPPSEVPPEALAQRNMILKIASKIMRAEAIEAGDRFEMCWRDYKRMIQKLGDME